MGNKFDLFVVGFFSFIIISNIFYIVLIQSHDSSQDIFVLFWIAVCGFIIWRHVKKIKERMKSGGKKVE